MTAVPHRVALITGAARGIGLAVVEKLSVDGMDIVAFDLPGSPFGEAIAAAKKHDRRVLAFEGDVTREEDWQRALGETNAAFGRLDVLVGNAGVSGPLGPLDACSAADFDHVMAVNARGVFLGMKTALPMLRQTKGCIVNVASISGLTGGRNTVAYTASKYAVVGMTQLAANEFAAYGVRVNAVCPAPTMTDMTAAMAQQFSPGDPNAFQKQFAKLIPLGRYGEPSEIADAIAFLAGERASFITGVAIPVDGGMRVR